jgi:hypothetical protein
MRVQLIAQATSGSLLTITLYINYILSNYGYMNYEFSTSRNKDSGTRKEQFRIY